MTTDRIPPRFRGEVIARIGHGGEATAYALRGDRVLRVYHQPPRDLDALARFYDALSSGDTGWALPTILERGHDEGVTWCVQQLVPGRPLIDVLPELRGDDRRRALDNYLEGAELVSSLAFDTGDSYGEPLPEDQTLHGDTWTGYLRARIERERVRTAGFLRDHLPRLDDVLAELDRRIARFPRRPARALVHGDYFPGNVIVGDDLRVTGLIDFGPLTAIGDAMMDVASAAIFLEVQRSWDPADTAYVTGRLLARHGEAARIALEAYRPWYAMRLAHCRDDDPKLYAWCLNALKAVA